MSTAATMTADLGIKARQRSWKDPQGYAENFQRATGPLKSPCHAAWRNAAHRKHVIEWLLAGIGLQLTLIVSYHGAERYATWWREWRVMKGRRMMVAVDRVSGDVFGSAPEGRSE